VLLVVNFLKVGFGFARPQRSTESANDLEKTLCLLGVRRLVAAFLVALASSVGQKR
jgi:hypothetical protein